MSTMFDHEKLKVYQQAILFVAWADELLLAVSKAIAVRSQLDRASTSIPLNIAEGNGKYTSSDRCRFFDIARGSALECAACLDVLVAKNLLNATDAMPGKAILSEIVSMLVGLIRSNSADRVYEGEVTYGDGKGKSEIESEREIEIKSKSKSKIKRKRKIRSKRKKG